MPIGGRLTGRLNWWTARRRHLPTSRGASLGGRVENLYDGNVGGTCKKYRRVLTGGRRGAARVADPAGPAIDGLGADHLTVELD